MARTQQQRREETVALTLSNPRLPNLTAVPVATASCATFTATTCTAMATIVDDDQGGVTWKLAGSLKH